VKKTAVFLLRISITLALLVFLFYKTDIRALADVFLRCDRFRMAEALGLFVFLNYLVLCRWQVLVRALGIDVPVGRLAASYLSSLFFNLVLPSTIGGDALRTFDIARHTQKHSGDILATVILDRVFGFFGLITVLVFALFFGYARFNDINILWATLVLLFFVVFFSGALFSNRFFHMTMRLVPIPMVRHYLQKVHDVSSGYRDRPSALVAAWGISCVIHVGLAVVYYLAAQAVGAPQPLAIFLIFVPMVTVFASLPVSIGGLGIRDAACVYVFSKVGMPAPQALALSLSNFAFGLFLGLAGGFCYVFMLHRRRV
jgi:uncharacterized protein (TIRG00374 family)